MRFTAEWESPNWVGLFLRYGIPIGPATISPQASFLVSEAGPEGAGALLSIVVPLGRRVRIEGLMNDVFDLNGRPLNLNATISLVVGDTSF